MSKIHPKTSGGALGGALGVLIVAILHSISGVHLAPEADAAIPTFLSALGSYLSPSSSDPAGVPSPSPPTTAAVDPASIDPASTVT